MTEADLQEIFHKNRGDLCIFRKFLDDFNDFDSLSEENEKSTSQKQLNADDPLILFSDVQQSIVSVNIFTEYKRNFYYFSYFLEHQEHIKNG